jgi:hypothetical protein
MAALGKPCGAAVVSKTLLTRLLATAVLLPTAVLVLLGFGRLLRALGDLAGGGMCDRLALAAGIAWVFALIALLYTLAVRQLSGPSGMESDVESELE